MIYDTKTEVQGLRNAAPDLRAEMQGLRSDIRVLYWITGATLAGVAGVWAIIITIGLHFILRTYR
ncbi:MAG: hypothetical protein ACRET5_04210 [Steroidobacteraceae bacterium]